MDYPRALTKALAANDPDHFIEGERDLKVWVDYFSDEVKDILETYFLGLREESSQEFSSWYLSRYWDQWNFQNSFRNDIFRVYINDNWSLVINLPDEKIEYEFVDKTLKILKKQSAVIPLFWGDQLKVDVLIATIPWSWVTLEITTTYTSKNPLFTVWEKENYQSKGTATMQFDARWKKLKTLKYSKLKHNLIQEWNDAIQINKTQKQKNIIQIYYRKEDDTLVLTIRWKEFVIELWEAIDKTLEEYMMQLKNFIEAE